MQLASCLHNTTPTFQDRNVIHKPLIFPSKGGSCVAVIFYEKERVLNKIFPCESKLYLACEGSAKSINVPDKSLYLPLSRSVRTLPLFWQIFPLIWLQDSRNYCLEPYCGTYDACETRVHIFQLCIWPLAKVRFSQFKYISGGFDSGVIHEHELIRRRLDK
jgi:hypothetical protein